MINDFYNLKDFINTEKNEKQLLFNLIKLPFLYTIQ
jgi:hypothetical protein